MDPALIELAEKLAPRALDETRRLVALSTPSGDIEHTERAVALCSEFLPGWAAERLPCSRMFSPRKRMMPLVGG